MKAKIVVEFDGEFAKDEAYEKLDDVQQLFLRRNPLDEPFIYIVTDEDEQE